MQWQMHDDTGENFLSRHWCILIQLLRFTDPKVLDRSTAQRLSVAEAKWRRGARTRNFTVSDYCSLLGIPPIVQLHPLSPQWMEADVDSYFHEHQDLAKRIVGPKILAVLKSCARGSNRHLHEYLSWFIKDLSTNLELLDTITRVPTKTLLPQRTPKRYRRKQAA